MWWSLTRGGMLEGQARRPVLLDDGEVEGEVGKPGDARGGGDGEHPCPDDVGGDAPADGFHALDAAHTRDGAGDSVGGGYGRSHISGKQNAQRGAGFGAESAARFQAGEASAHGAYDAPTAAHGRSEEHTSELQ